MPLGFQRSSRKVPASAANTEGRHVGQPEGSRPALSSNGVGRPRLFLGLPMGWWVTIGLCGLVLLMVAIVNLLPSPGASAPDAAGQATATLEAASEPVGSAEALNAPAVQALPSPALASSAATAVAGSPTNPWTSQIPEAACIPADLPQTGKVVEVVDGETIRVLMDRDRRVYTVRYIGIDTVPGSSQYPALNAKLKNMQLAYGQRVTMIRDLTDMDEYGRLLRYVMVEQAFVNYELVAEGYARVLPSPPDTACVAAFEAAEQQASSNHLGIWAASTP